MKKENDIKIFEDNKVRTLWDDELLKIIETGPQVFSKQTLIDKKYPTVPSREYYLVYKVEKLNDVEFTNRNWDITKLNDFKTNRGSGLPFAATLTELMNAIVK